VTDLNLDQLKIVYGSIITERKVLTKEQKVYLLDEIQHEDDMHQFISILLDGERKESLDDIERLELEGRFISSDQYDMIQEASRKRIEV